MRNGWRKVLACTLLFLTGTVGAAPPDPLPLGATAPVHLTVELGWRFGKPLGKGISIEFELSEGRIADAVAWPDGTAAPLQQSPNGWRVPADASSRVRARLEAPLTASLLVRGAGQAIRLPLAGLLDGPQRLAAGELEVTFERLPWDAIEVVPDDHDGITAPGSLVPLSLRYNLLAPEPTEVALRTVAELRPAHGGDTLWRQEWHQVVTTNLADAPVHAWQVPMPLAEGTYVLEIHASWEPVAGLESTRLGRWFRRRRNPAAAMTSVRRLILAAVDPNAPPPNSATPGPEQLVESIDLSRVRGQRPTASGRAPLRPSGDGTWAVPDASLVEATRRDRLRGWILRSGSEVANLGPSDANGLPWSALGLKVPHPGRPHRLTLTVVDGLPAALGVALVRPGLEPRLLLDACASAPAGSESGTPATFSWLVWPDAPDTVLVLVNRSLTASVQVGTVTLTELSDLPAAPAIVEPATDPRGIGLYLASASIFDRFGGGGTGLPDALATAQNVARYLTYCGASTLVVPENLTDRSRRRSLEGQAAEDATGPDRLDVLLRVLARQKCAAWLELALETPLPGLPPADSAEALKRGLVRIDRQGQADGPVYHPLHPDVREALKRRIADTAAPRKGRDGLAGLLVRLGRGPTLLGGPDTGFDDNTYTRFVQDTFGAETLRNIPGLGTSDPNRFTARSQFLAGAGRMPWLTWRTRAVAALYADLAQTARKAAPGTVLAVATPELDETAVGQEARRVDLAGLAPSHAWRAVGLDLETWPAGEGAPVVLRGVGLSTDDLAHDLATSPELDAQVVSRARRGVLIGAEEESQRTTAAHSQHKTTGDSGLRLSALPILDGPAADEPLGHALASLDPRWVLMSMTAVAGQEERVRRFARVFRAIPATTATRVASEREPFGLAVRTHRAGSSSYLSLANDTPYPVRLETILATSGNTTVDDLGRGLRLAPEAVNAGSRLVLDLPPFGMAAIRVGHPQLQVGSVTPYPSEAVLADILARYNALTEQLARLNRSPAGGGPPNPGFEPTSTPVVQLTAARGPTLPAGWQLVGEAPNAIEIDATSVHSGRGSLRLDAKAPPAAAACEKFDPKAKEALTVRAWFRSADADTKARVWIEGETGGQPFVRFSELVLQPDWSAQAIRVSSLPPGGLDSLRLRVEMLTPGRLWVDDLAVLADVPTEPERLNTRRVLMAALHAYREKRYADFARLAGSHWARTKSGSGVTTAGRTSADRGEMIRTGEASALPPNRLLR